MPGTPENKGVETKENVPAEKPAEQPAPAAEPTPQPEAQPDEQVSISKAELEKLQKKAVDFDGIIEKKRLEKMAKREDKNKQDDDSTPPPTAEVTAEDIQRMVQENVNRAMSQVMGQQQTVALQGAYRAFLKSHPWADSDEVISQISDTFSAGTSTDEKELLAKLEMAAMQVNPVAYQKSVENRIRNQVLAGNSDIQAGEGGGAGAAEYKQPQAAPVITDEDRRMADRFFGGNIERWLKYGKGR